MPTVSLISDRCPTCAGYGEHAVHRFPSGLTVQVCEQGDCTGARCWTPKAVLLALAAGPGRHIDPQPHEFVPRVCPCEPGRPCPDHAGSAR